MKNYIQDGEYLDLTAPYDVASGGGALVGITFGVAVTSVLSGAVGSFATCGVFTMSKGTGASTGGAQGTAAYWNNTSKVITAVSSGNTKVGVFAATCLDADATCRVRLNGSF
jgi:predicted RecA/RadA family phage recombinase